MTKLKFLVSLLLALGLVACNGDEDETDDAKYSLKVAKPSSPAVGADFTVEVKLYKGDAIVKDDDAKNAKDAKVSGSIKCKEGEKVTATDGKFDAAGKASLTVNIADNSDKTATADGTKGYTDCVVSASTEFGDDKTKASGASDKFGVAAKTADTSDDNGDEEITIEVANNGEVTIDHAEATDMIKLVDDGGTCGGFLVSWNTSNNIVKVARTNGLEGNSPGLWIVGAKLNCKLTVGAGDDAKEDDLSGYTSVAGGITIDVSATDGVTLNGVSGANPAPSGFIMTVHANANADTVVENSLKLTADITLGTKTTGFTLATDNVVWVKYNHGVQRQVKS